MFEIIRALLGIGRKPEKPATKKADKTDHVVVYSKAPVMTNMNGHMIPLWKNNDGSFGVKVNDIPEDAMDDVMDYICKRGDIAMMFGY